MDTLRCAANAALIVFTAVCLSEAMGRAAQFDQAVPASTSTPAATEPNPSALSREKDSTTINLVTGFGAVSSDQYRPLDAHQRWEYYIHQNFTTAGAYFGPVSSSVLDQIAGQPPEWGGGMAGYGRRLASRLGTTITQSTIQSTGAALLGHEPRYIRSADRSIARRIGHAFLFSFVTYNNEGEIRPAVATLGACYASSMIATYWYPDRFTPSGDGVRDGNRQIITSAIMNQVQEFWPEITRYVFRRK